MEATGVYWRPVWAVLEGQFEQLLVNPQHIKAVPGRKTDVKDSEWNGAYLRPLWDVFRFHVLRHIQAPLCHTWHFRQQRRLAHLAQSTQRLFDLAVRRDRPPESNRLLLR